MRIRALYRLFLPTVLPLYTYTMDLPLEAERDAPLEYAALQQRLETTQKTIENLQAKSQTFPNPKDKALLELFLSIETDDAQRVNAQLQQLQGNGVTQSTPAPHQQSRFIAVGGLLLKPSHNPYVCTLIEVFKKYDTLIDHAKNKLEALEELECPAQEKHASQFYYNCAIEHYEVRKKYILRELGNNPQLSIF